MLTGKCSPVRLTLRPVRPAVVCRLLPLMLAVISLAAENSNPANRAETPSAARPNVSARARLSAAYADLPLSFEPNVGQIRGDGAAQVHFLSRGSGYTLYLTGRDAELALRSRVNRSSSEVGSRSPWASANERSVSSVLRMRLVGANSGDIVAINELPGKSNYLVGNDPQNWRTSVGNYGQVVERDVYPGIDLRYHGNQTQLEYDFDVAPGADASAIRLAFEGVSRLRIDSGGDLLVKVDGGELRFHKPIAYQQAQGVKHIVASRFVLRHKHQIAFRLAKYDTRQPLVIDPILAYSTYLGGSSIDGANGIAVAPDGTAFIAGGTFSTDFPTAHALQPNAGGPADFPQDAFVSKISADGSTLLYSTYLGGKNTDVANAIAVDDSGEAYVTGTTNSPDFPVTPAAWTTICGGDGVCGASLNLNGFLVFNAFVTKLNAAGSALVYSGFLGTYQNDVGSAIALDGNGNAYVTGETGPQAEVTVALIPPAEPPGPFPTTAGAFQSTFGGATDAFVTKIDATGSELLYSSFLGGSGEDVGYGIAADASANAYVTGLTYSTDLPITAGTALQSSYAGAGDAFLTKVDTNGTAANSLVYSTYLGGSGLDQGNGIAVDSSGNAYLAGGTSSAAKALSFKPPLGAYQADCVVDPVGVCESDAFMARLNPALTGAASLTYFTYLGGSLADSASGVAVDTSGDVYVTGSTVSTNFPTGPSGVPVFQPEFGGGNADAFVTELNPAGAGSSDLVYSTYLGGTNTDSGTGIALNPSVFASSCPVSGKIPVCDAYVAGQTCSLDFPLANPLQAAPAGNCDAFVSEISVLVGIALNPGGLFFTTQNIGPASQPLKVTLTNGDAALSITSIAVTGTNASDFAQTNTCGTSVSAGEQCTISVTFTPTAAGIRKASVTITDSAPGSPQIINLTGSTSTVTLSSSSLAFGSQPVGVTSSPQTVTVTNTGTSSLTISSITASGDFAETNDCSVPLQPSTNCVISVTYTPSVAISSIGALTLTDNATGSPQVVLLTGTGVPAATAALSATAITFANQPVGASSAAQNVTLTNTGGATLLISNIAVAGDFTESTTCGAFLNAGGGCTISVTFKPTAVGSRYGTVTVTDSAANSPQTITLAGTGLAAPALTVSPTSLSFSSQEVGTASAAQSVTLTNSGTAALNITSITTSPNFTQSGSCGQTVAASATCTVNVAFSPATGGSLTGTLTITDNAPGSPQVVTLGGVGSDFAVMASPSSATVVAGNSLSLTVTVTPKSGFSAAVALSCSGLPPLSSCSASPASVTPNGTTSATAMLTISTTVRSSSPPGFGRRLLWPPVACLSRLAGGSRWLWLLAAMVLLGLSRFPERRFRLRPVRLVPAWVVLAITVLVLMCSLSCGGGGNGYTDPVGTAAGTYQVVLTGTSGTLSHSVTVALTVK
ncbi:MAG TPA: choice-of-anchor D domain-containing protein [Terriglobia bacterium]|nr:choice-of-anchor D domain-containing protein [Terriglobia bacterium]